MDRVEQIQAALNELQPDEFRRISRWVNEREQTLWDQQLEHDASMGKLDFLVEEATPDGNGEPFREWPSSR